MMKNLIYGSFLVFCSLCSACEDALRVTPGTSVTFETAFENEKEIETGLLTVERYVRRSNVNAHILAMFGEYSDYHSEFDLALLNFFYVSSYFTTRSSILETIPMANVPLPYIDKVSMSQDRRDFYKGQIYFTKALMYYDLGRRYKFTPIIREEVELEPVEYSNWLTVVDYAIEQAQKAVKLLPEFPDLRDSDGNPIQRKSVPGKGAANALLAHLYAWKAGCKYMASPEETNYDEMALWRAADSACTAIISREDIYELAITPEKVCTSVLLGNSREGIYENQIRGYGNELDMDFLTKEPFGLGYFYQTWPVVPNEGIGNIQLKSYRLLVKTVREMYSTRIEKGDTIMDLRRGAYFYKLDSMAHDTLLNITGGYAYPWKFREVRLGTSGWDTGKFVNYDQNKIWFRLADIILLRAECRSRLGNDAGAIEDLNRIRSRARAKLYDSSEYGGDLRYAIFKEREKELLMEGWRWFDVIRNGYYKTELYGGFRDVSEQDIIDGCFFLGIFQTEFTNTLARQNTYWLKHQ